MTEQRSRNLPPIPPPPPPPPTASTQRQVTQTLDMATQTSAGGSTGMNTAPPATKTMSDGANQAKATAMNTIHNLTIPQNDSSRLTLSQLIREAFDQGYSDVHVGVGEIPRFRNRGEIQPTSHPETSQETFFRWLREIMNDTEIQRFQDNLEFDGATQYDFARIRINVFDSLKGPALVLRLIPLKILSMEQLRLPAIFQKICHVHKGLILVTGPTGSGKSTTMAAMIDYINREMAKHIITIEDPIEFVHQSRKSLVKQREVGMHTRKFDNALKAALREDPDLILVGEMRDKETVNTALKAAQTGHLVMGTLHTNSAVKTIERILNLFSGAEQDAMRVAISESLVCVIAQGLCRTTDGKRAAFHDILINTEAVKEWIKDAKYDEITELMKQAGFDGMITMNQSLLNLYQEGRITEETALDMSPTPNEMAQFLKGRI
jgi:twitching motility protein PilT